MLTFPNVCGRKKVALVLGGGGAKGAAEVGVLKYIEESGIPVDYIVGTSIGSIVGGLYSVGYRADQLDSLFRNQRWLDLLTSRSTSRGNRIFHRDESGEYLFGFPISKKNKSSIRNPRVLPSLVKGDSIVSMLQELTKCRDSINFDSLPIPYRCVAVDIREMEEVVLSSGNLSMSMRSSMSIPLVYKPVEIDGRLLVDGGLLNNLPVDVARRMGADYVIAVDLTQHKHLENDAQLSYGKSGIAKLISWALNRPDLKKYNENCKNADIYINPDLEGMGAADFSMVKISKMILEGEKAGKKALPNLKKLTKIIKKYK